MKRGGILELQHDSMGNEWTLEGEPGTTVEQ